MKKKKSTILVNKYFVNEVNNEKLWIIGSLRYDEITFFKKRILSNQNNYQDNEKEMVNSETESGSDEHYEIIESENDDTNNFSISIHITFLIQFLFSSQNY